MTGHPTMWGFSAYCPVSRDGLHDTATEWHRTCLSCGTEADVPPAPRRWTVDPTRTFSKPKRVEPK